jgi:hypothetical protein
MKNLRLQSTIFLILMLSSVAILRGQPITIETLIAPPFAPNVSTYLDQNVIKITNSSNAPISIYLKGTLTSDNGINGKTKDGYKPLNPIIVPANNQPVILQASRQNRVDFFDSKNIEYNTGNYNIVDIARTGVIPEGNYTLCITAYDFTTSEVKSRIDNGFNCRTFSIILPQPPTVDCDVNVPTMNGATRLEIGNANNPANVNKLPQLFINFSWLPTNANARNLIVAYDLYLLKLIPNQNGQDALLTAIRNRQNNPIKFENIRTNTYTANLATTPSLVPGRYAWAVVAKDGGGGQTAFENNGISQVCEFEWASNQPVAPIQPNPQNPQNQPRVAQVEPECSCLLQPIPDAVSNETLKLGDIVKIGAYQLRVNTVQPDPTGGWKGTGNIRLRLVGMRLVPILVDFEKLTFAKIGPKLEAKTGIARAQKHDGGPSLAPHVVIPDKPKLLPVSAADATAYDNYFNRNKDKVLSNLKESYENSGIQLPLGIDGQDLPTIAVVSMTFTPLKAWFDAVAGMEISDEPAPNNWLAFGASGVCMRTDDSEGLCGDVKLYLAEDLNLTSLNLKLFGAKGADLKDACHLLIKDSSVDSAYLVGEYAFSKRVLKRTDNKNDDVKVSMKFRARSWSSWYATVEMPDFKIAGAEDFKFSNKIAYYDHTDKYNPAGMPAYYTEGAVPQWQGFFIPEITAELPPILKKNDNTPTNIKVTNLLIDKQGVSVKIFGSDVINIQSGTLDGWAFSLDKIDVEILKSTFKHGTMNGKIMLPISKKDKQSELDYDALLTYKDDTLKYNFNIKPKADLEIPIWAARINLTQNSRITVSNQNVKTEFRAEAHLHGEISINTHDVDKRLPNFNLVGLKFENLYLKSFKDPTKPKDDYVGVDTTYFTGAFASPPKTAGGFPLAITSFKLSPQPGANATFKIGLALNISDIDLLPKAEAELYLKANIGLDANKRLEPTFVGIEPTAIRLTGNIGPVNINGALNFYEGDAVYGNGIYGRLNAKMMKEGDNYKMDLGSVAAQFGTKDGRPYWFVDAMVKNLDKLVPAVQIYNLGGGAYYNMTADKLPDLVALKAAAPVANGALPLGESVSGTKYIPSPTGKLGFKAMAYFGIIKKEVLNVDAFLSMEFNTNTGGMSKIVFKGKGRYLEPTPGSEPLAGGSLDVEYDAEQKIFSAGIQVVSKRLPIKQASFYLYFAPQGWHVKLGRPSSINNGADVIVITLLPLIDANGYFQVGNYMVDAAPDLPADVIRILNETGVDVTQLKENRSPSQTQSGLAIAFGAGITIKAEGEFGPIYGKVLAIAGFDLSLQDYGDLRCDNSNGRIGLDGWYARGQFYAAVEAVIGIKLDLGFFDANIEILRGAAAAALRGGGPNPFWGNGAMGIKVKLLGLIEGKLNYQFSFGTKCDPLANGDALAAIKIISEVKPTDGAVIDVDEFQSVAFNYKTNSSFSIDEYNDKGDKNTRYFGFKSTNITAKLTNKKLNKTVDITLVFPNNDRSAMIIQPKALLDAETPYELSIDANMTEYKNGQASVAKKKDGTPFNENKTISFSTNKGLESIKEDRVKDLNPVWNQRYFIKTDDRPNGFVETNQQYSLSGFNIPRGNGITSSAVVRFVKMNVQANAQPSPESPVNINGNRWEFNLPPLEPQQIYVAQLIIRWKNGGAFNSQTGVVSKIKTTNVLSNGNDYARSEQALNSDRLGAASNEKIVFSINFKTSQYADYATKLRAMKFREVVAGVAGSNQTARINVGNEPQSTIANNIAQWVANALNLPLAGLQVVPFEFNFSTLENFDLVDVGNSNGDDANTNYTKINVSIQPRVSFNNTAFDSWADNVFRNVQNALVAGGAGNLYRYIGAGGLKSNVGYGYAEDKTFRITALEKIQTYPDPLLTEEEVKGGASPSLQTWTGKYIPGSNASSIGGSFGGYQTRPALTMKYATMKPTYNINVVAGAMDGLNWGVNPTVNQFGAIGNAFSAGVNAANLGMGGMNLGVNGKGLNMSFR